MSSLAAVICSVLFRLFLQKRESVPEALFLLRFAEAVIVHGGVRIGERNVDTAGPPRHDAQGQIGGEGRKGRCVDDFQKGFGIVLQKKIGIRHVFSCDGVPGADVRVHQERFTVHFLKRYPFILIDCRGMCGNYRNKQVLASACLAEKYGKSNAQIILRWHIQNGDVVFPGSRNPEHIRDNFDIFDFELTDEEMAEIAKLDKNIRYYNATPEDVEKYASMELDFDAQE